jgi:hypothetical protein
MTILRKIWKWIGDNSERIKIISGIFVAGYAVEEYLSVQRATKVTRALDYITAATSHDIMTSRVATELFAAQRPMSDNITPEKLWNPKSQSVCSITTYSKCVPEAENTEAMNEIRSIINSNEEIKTHVHNLINVYYDVGTCGLSKQCDPHTICQAFYPEISGFYTKYYGYLQYFETNWNIGKLSQIGNFVDMCEPYIAIK